MIAPEELAECALCEKSILLRDSYSPADEAICAECDTEVTGRIHPPSLPVTEESLATLTPCNSPTNTHASI